MNYCLRYPISFDKDKVKDVEEGEYLKYHLRRFYDGWGDKDWMPKTEPFEKHTDKYEKWFKENNYAYQLEINAI